MILDANSLIKHPLQNSALEFFVESILINSKMPKAFGEMATAWR